MDAFIDPGLWVAMQFAWLPEAPAFLLIHYGINAYRDISGNKSWLLRRSGYRGW